MCVCVWEYERVVCVWVVCVGVVCGGVGVVCGVCGVGVCGECEYEWCVGG